MEKIIEYKRKVFYYETDRMNVVHHSNYIRWFEEARVYFMEQVGYSYARMESEGLMMPVVSVDCKYRKSVKFGDTVVIKTAVTEFDGFKMEVRYEVINNDTNEICAKGSSSHCFTNMSMKPVRIKKTFSELYNLYVNYVIENPF